MRIFHLIPRLGNGGAEKLLQATLPFYDSNQLEIKLICITDKSEISRELEKLNIEVLYLNRPGKMFDILAVLKLFKILSKEKPDHLISHLLMANFFGWLASLILGVKHSIVIHNLNTEYSKRFVFVHL